MLWVNASCSQRDVLAWLAVVHGYEVSFILIKCFYYKKADVSTAIMQSSSEHTQHAQRLLCMLWWRLQNCSRNVSFFLIKHLVGIKDTS